MYCVCGMRGDPLPAYYVGTMYSGILQKTQHFTNELL